MKGGFLAAEKRPVRNRSAFFFFFIKESTVQHRIKKNKYSEPKVFTFWKVFPSKQRTEVKKCVCSTVAQQRRAESDALKHIHWSLLSPLTWLSWMRVNSEWRMRCQSLSWNCWSPLQRDCDSVFPPVVTPSGSLRHFMNYFYVTYCKSAAYRWKELCFPRSQERQTSPRVPQPLIMTSLNWAGCLQQKDEGK